MTDQELKDLVASLAIESQKTNEKMQELRDSQLQTDRQLKETDRQLKETDRQLKKTDEQLQKSEEAFNRRIKKLEKLVGGISNNQGDVAEEYFVNSLAKKLKLGVIDFDYLVPNYVIKAKDIVDEYDILLVNGKSVAIIEVKYKFHINDLNKIPRKINNLKKLPQYQDYKIYAGIAGFNIADNIVETALKKGYFVLKRSGNLIETFGDNILVA